MIIYTRSSFTIPFFLIIQALNIAVIIIRPNQHNIFKHFFIRNKNLWNRIKRSINVLFQNLPLVGNNFFYQTDFLILRNSYKPSVMNTTHSNRINVFIWSIPRYPLVEYLIDSFFVGHVIPFSHCFLIPLRYIIKQ